MDWSTLYSAKRTGDKERKETNPDTVRTSFVRDYDRIIFSSAFRRLQNKTQVFPLPGAVFVHNRLTHSLEVASVGRSLGKAAGDVIAASATNPSESFIEFYKYELPSVIAAACLAHDIGNPPFGHSGEDAIRSYFTNLSADIRQMLTDHLSSEQLCDFERFEGNANALRILTHHFNECESGGYNLTYTTLASIVKYPCSSSSGFNKNSGTIATKKSGFFDSERAVFSNIAKHLGIPRNEHFGCVYARHPFVYLTEAADDICYRVMDLEDAHRLYIVSHQQFSDLFLPFFEGEEGYNGIDHVRKKLNNIKDRNQKVQYIRAKWIGLMVTKLSEVFVANENKLLNGTLEVDLLHCLPAAYQALLDEINSFSFQHIYNYRSVIEIELAGFNVIGGLLKEFVNAVIHPRLERSKKLLLLLPGQFLVTGDRNKLYQDIQAVVDFVAGMTDLYALDLYRKITGITIPELR